MKQKISFESQHGIHGIEAVLSAIDAHPNRRLLLPTNLQKRHFGVDASVIQALITWVRRGGADLEIYGNENPSNAIERLIHNDHGFVALLLAKRVFTRGSSTELPIPQDLLRSRLDQSVNSNIKLGPKLFFLIKDRRQSIDNITPLYHQTTFADDGMLLQHEFTRLTKEQIRGALVTAKNITANQTLVDELLTQICTVLFELYENTHRWARTDASGDFYPWSLRAIRIEVHRNDITALRAQSQPTAPIHKYLTHRYFEDFRSHVRLLEVSVLDSGPGLAARALNRALTQQDDRATEVDAAESRFLLHKTSSGSTHRGRGLPEVLRILSKHNGFLRVRTGKLNMFRDFIARPYNGCSGPTNSSASTFSDWSDLAAEASPARAEGVLITFLFPFTHLGF
jgi:hypothetical protein